LAYSGDPVRKVLDKALPHNGAVWRFRRQDIEHEIVLADEEAELLILRFDRFNAIGRQINILIGVAGVAINLLMLMSGWQIWLF
jgi:hypothetical protein